MLMQALTNAQTPDTGTSPKPQPTRDFAANPSFVAYPGLSVGLDSFRILQDGGIFVTLVLRNSSKNEDALLAINSKGVMELARRMVVGRVVDSKGNDFVASASSVTGVHCYDANSGFNFSVSAFELLLKDPEMAKKIVAVEPGQEVKTTMTFYPTLQDKKADAQSAFRLQCEIIAGIVDSAGKTTFKTRNFVVDDIKPDIQMGNAPPHPPSPDP